jgi:ribose/xylose/arabinose/galactoside ABC-type transport system permease subunit
MAQPSNSLNTPKNGVLMKFLQISALQARLIVLAVLVILFAFRTPYFWGLENLVNIVVNASVVGIVSCAMTLLLVARQIDISVGSAVGLSGAVLVMTAQSHSIIEALVLSLAAALFASMINIIAIIFFRVDSIIVTLAGFVFFRGISKIILDGQSLTINNFDFLGSYRLNVFGVVKIPIPVLIFAVVLVYFYLLMKFTRYGSQMYAIGANPESSRLAGIKLEWQVAKAFLLMGVAVFLATITNVSMLGIASTTTGQGLEFLSLTAVILGGVGLAGGRGNVLGTLVAVLILAVIDNALVLSGVKPFWQEVARGSLLLAAVIFDQISRRNNKSVRMSI